MTSETGYGLKEKQKNDGVWINYLEKLVRAFGPNGNLIVIGNLLETNFDRSSFFPYSSSRTTALEENYIFVNEGDPRTVRSEFILDMEIIPSEYLDKLLNDTKKLNDIKQNKIKIDDLETSIKLIELEQKLNLLKNENK